MNQNLKQKFVDRFNTLIHNISSYFTPFTLYPAYFKDRILDQSEKILVTRAIANIQVIENQLKDYFKDCHTAFKNTRFQILEQELMQNFKEFYVATNTFLREKQPQLEAAEAGEKIIKHLMEILGHIERVLETKVTAKTNMISTMAAQVKAYKKGMQKK